MAFKGFRWLREIPGQLDDAALALEGAKKALADSISQMRAEAEKISRLEAESAELRNQIKELSGRLVRDSLRDRAVIMERLDARTPAARGPATIDRAMTLSNAYASLRTLAPRAYDLWRPLIDVNAQAYDGFPIDSCSVRHHPMGELFRCFLRTYWGGRALDIGCGPQPMPWYLEGYNPDDLHGIDPLGSVGDHPFHFFPGVAEFLPWADAQFRLVVVGTSLDHVLLLDRALAEIHRVLEKPHGRAVLWLAFVPGAAPYDPFASELRAIDRFHLFHFDRGWFEAAIDPWFTIEEQFELRPLDTSVYYSLRPRENVGHSVQTSSATG